MRLARERGLLLRANRWSSGDGLDFALARGAATAGDLDEFYGRAMPAPPAQSPSRTSSELSQLYGRYAEVVAETRRRALRGRAVLVGDRSRPDDRSLARRPCLVPGPRGPTRRTGSRADGRGHDRRSPRGRARSCWTSRRSRRCSSRRVSRRRWAALRIDERARVVGAEGLYAAGADVGGISTGGYSSGLAAALVFGRIAAEQALS